MLDQFTEVFIDDQFDGDFEHAAHGWVCQYRVPFPVEDNHTISNGVQDRLVATGLNTLALKGLGECLCAIVDNLIQVGIDITEFCECLFQTSSRKPRCQGNQEKTD